MALNAFGLGFIFSAKDGASPVMARVSGNFGTMDKATARSAANMQRGFASLATGGMAAMAAGAVGLGATLKTALAAGEFELGVAKVGAISQATAVELKALEERAIRAGIETQFSPTEAIEGLAELSVRGLNARESMDALKGSLDLAAGGQISIASASSTTASALKVFGLEADQAGLAADKLLKISNITALQAKDLELALGTVGRGAGLAKQSIDEMLPSIGLVKNTGVDASVAASSVSSALIFMSKNAKKFKKLGVALTDTRGKIRPFMDIVFDAQGALSGMTDETDRIRKATELFGRFGVGAFSAIGNQIEKGIRTPTGEILKGAEAIQFLRDQMTGAAGTAEKFRKALLDTLPGQIILLKGSLQTLAISLGQPLATLLKPFVANMIDGVNDIIEAVRKMPAPVRKIMVVFSILASLAVFLGGAFVFVTAMIGLMLPALGFMGAALGTVATVMGNLFVAGAALAAIGSLIGVAFRNNIGGLATAIQGPIEKVKLFFSALFQLIEDGFFTGDTARKLIDPENAPILQFFQFIVTAGTRAKVFFDGFITGISIGLLQLDPVISIVTIAFDGLMFIISEISEFFFGPMTTSMDTVRGAGNKLGNVVALLAGAYLTWKIVTVALRAAQFSYNAMLVIIKGTVKAYEAVVFLARTATAAWTFAIAAQESGVIGLQIALVAAQIKVSAMTAATWLANAAAGAMGITISALQLLVGGALLIAVVAITAAFFAWGGDIASISDIVGELIGEFRELIGLKNDFTGQSTIGGAASFLDTPEARAALGEPAIATAADLGGSMAFENNVTGAAEAEGTANDAAMADQVAAMQEAFSNALTERDQNRGPAEQPTIRLEGASEGTTASALNFGGGVSPLD